MTHKKLCKTLNAAALTGGTIMAASALAAAPQGAYGFGYGQDSDMMGDHGAGWMDGGYGIWLTVLLVVVVAGLVAWIVAQKKK